MFLPGGIILLLSKNEEPILIAGREGAANCTTTFRLEKDNKFREKTVCFGLNEITGSYLLRDDTIFFDKKKPGRDVKEYYKFAVIKSRDPFSESSNFDLVRYKHEKDTVGSTLWIVRNNLPEYSVSQ